jgi:chromosome segregation ATPase
MEFSTLQLIVLAAAAAGAFALGWSIRRTIAGGQEAELKRSLYESKGAVPQLEAAVRTRDQRIGNYQTEAEQLRSRISALETSLAQKDNELVKRDRDLRRVSSELAIVKEGGDAGALHPEMQMVDVDERSNNVPPPTGDGDARLKQIEARYEALKRGLIARDDRITELEATLNKSPARALESELDSLRKTMHGQAELLAERDATIKALQTRAQEDAEQRVQFETLAKRRTETNRELKEKLFKFEQKLPKLMETLKSRNDIIAERDTAIRGLRSNLAEVTGQRDGHERSIASLKDKLAERDSRLAVRDSELSARNEKITLLQQQISNTEQMLTQTQTNLLDRERAIETLAAKLASAAEVADAAAQDKAQAVESLKSAVRDREFRIASLESEGEQLKGAVARLEADLAQATPLLATHQSELAAAKASAQASIRDKDHAIESMKGALRDRDVRIHALTMEVEQLTRSVAELSDAAARTETHADKPSEVLPEQQQDGVVASLQQALRDRDLRIDGLISDVDRLTTTVSQLKANVTPAPVQSNVVPVLESQLAEARRRAERAEDELLAAVREMKELRERIVELESPAAPAENGAS